MPDLETIDLATVDESTFRPHVDSEFTLRCEAGEFPVTLMSIAEYPDHRAEDERQRRKPFGLVFQCGSTVLAQGIYTVGHPDLPSCDLFLSPFDGGEGWCKLEAIFN